ATGLAGGCTGTRVVEDLTAEGILNDFVRIADESRTTTAVVDPTGPSYTEINEWGPRVEPEELAMLLEKITYLSCGADLVVFAGTLPREVGENFYAEAIRDLNRRGVRAALDAEGEPLRLGTEAEPFLVSPKSPSMRRCARRSRPALRPSSRWGRAGSIRARRGGCGATCMSRSWSRSRRELTLLAVALLAAACGGHGQPRVVGHYLVYSR